MKIQYSKIQKTLFPIPNLSNRADPGLPRPYYLIVCLNITEETKPFKLGNKVLIQFIKNKNLHRCEIYWIPGTTLVFLCFNVGDFLIF
jgi:hypothetical protein